MGERRLYRGTNEDLLAHALEPTLRWLIAAALDGTVMTYGEIKHKLETKAGFSTIFATRIGFVVGNLMEAIQKKRSDAPLINVLAVNQMDRQPSEGAGSFMANRFGEPRLAEDDAKRKHRGLWEKTFQRAAGEVYAYSAQDWAQLYGDVFGNQLVPEQIENVREERRRGQEQDGIRTGREYGKGGEGPFHSALRLWVKDNPQAIHRDYDGAQTDTEVDLESGDRVDVVFKCADRIVLLEVKSRISNEVDLRRGVYQCIKYRAVRAAMDVRDEPVIETYLVTETEIPGEIAALLRLHEIKHFQAPWTRR